MKTLFYIILGIVLGIIAIRFIVGAVVALFSLMIVTCLIDVLLGLGAGILASKCFKKSL